MCIRDRVEAEVVYSPMVAESQEYQYNADAFEARGVDEDVYKRQVYGMQRKDYLCLILM